MSEATLRAGSCGAAVSELQEKLEKLGFTIAVDGFFGLDTERVVKEVQTLLGRDPDGEVDARTLELIDARLEKTPDDETIDPAAVDLASPRVAPGASKPAGAPGEIRSKR
jgi:peptidoglycan hydrolase-like protein with peptidoglycan-binding domain